MKAVFNALFGMVTILSLTTWANILDDTTIQELLVDGAYIIISKQPLTVIPADLTSDDAGLLQDEKQRTFAMIKPDAVAAGHADDIIKQIEADGFTILAKKQITMSKEQAHRLYGVHQGKPFFDDIVDFITSGPVVLLALEKDDAITDWRRFMGATDPAKAASGTLRKRYGIDVGHNAVHGSDAPETAEAELSIFFPQLV